MRLLYQTLLCFLLATFALSETAYADCCNAGFSSTHLSNSQGLTTFQFTMDDSLAADMLYPQWAFGDGTYSNEKNPVHSYGYTGSYSVTLTVFKQMVNGVQKSCSETHVVSVESNCSNFIYSKEGRNVSFLQVAAFNIDSSSAWAQNRTFVWTFGDGQTSSLMNPTHVYTAEGTYTACLYQYRNDSSFVDSCYACQTFVVQDTIVSDTCNAGFTYQINGSVLFVSSLGVADTSTWWIQGNPNPYYGQEANLPLPPDSLVMVCHITGIYMDSTIQYCEACETVYNPLPQNPIDTIYKPCDAAFSYELTDSIITLHPTTTYMPTFWWLEHNGINLGWNYAVGDTILAIPETGDLSICHIQYSLFNGISDSCVVCKVLRIEQDTLPSSACYSDFNYVVNGNVVTVQVDTMMSGRHTWNFSNEGIRYDSAVSSYAFMSSGMKRICHTATNLIQQDSCTTCKDVQIDAAPVNISPNPAVDSINVSINGGFMSVLEIYDSNGVLVKHVAGLNVATYTADVSNLTSGMYYVSILLTDGRSSSSVIIIE